MLLRLAPAALAVLVLSAPAFAAQFLLPPRVHPLYGNELRPVLEECAAYQSEFNREIAQAAPAIDLRAALWLDRDGVRKCAMQRAAEGADEIARALYLIGVEPRL